MEIQKAGNNSVQIQAGNITLDITEDCAKEYAWLSERVQKIIDDRMARDLSTQ